RFDQKSELSVAVEAPRPGCKCHLTDQPRAFGQDQLVVRGKHRLGNDRFHWTAARGLRRIERRHESRVQDRLRRRFAALWREYRLRDGAEVERGEQFDDVHRAFRQILRVIRQPADQRGLETLHLIGTLDSGQYAANLRSRGFLFLYDFVACPVGDVSMAALFIRPLFRRRRRHTERYVLGDIDDAALNREHTSTGKRQAIESDDDAAVGTEVSCSERLYAYASWFRFERFHFTVNDRPGRHDYAVVRVQRVDEGTNDWLTDRRDLYTCVEGDAQRATGVNDEINA